MPIEINTFFDIFPLLNFSLRSSSGCLIEIDDWTVGRGYVNRRLEVKVSVKQKKQKRYEKSRSTTLWWDLMGNEFVYYRIAEDGLRWPV